MNAPHEAMLEQATVTFKLNGGDVAAVPGETILEVADRLGVEIPRLCYKAGLRPDGNCRSCMVEIKGERVLAPSCCRAPAAGMEVSTDSARAVAAQKMIVELLEELSVAMADASICGLGQAAPNPIRCVAKHFAHEV